MSAGSLFLTSYESSYSHLIYILNFPYHFPGTKEENAVLFDNLTALNMNSTKIEEWNELDKLSGIRSLQDVRLSGIPLCEVSEREIPPVGTVGQYHLRAQISIKIGRLCCVVIYHKFHNN